LLFSIEQDLNLLPWRASRWCFAGCVKVQRGWKSYQTQLAEGQRIHYDFVKPHMALGGKTPAEAAGIKVKGWKDLLELAMSQANI
jgi:hypothetical protein